jgi:hypothetical protein
VQFTEGVEKRILLPNHQAPKFKQKKKKKIAKHIKTKENFKSDFGESGDSEEFIGWT